MSVSMRELFSRQGIPNEIISLRNSLANHPEGIRMSLREAHRRLLDDASGDGFSRGCRRPESVKISIPGIFTKELGGVLPAWVPAAGSTPRDQNPSHADFAGETRTVEGILARSHITSNDFPFKPWHTFYDWNFHVRFDKQYTYLTSPANREGEIECEWDTAFLPIWAFPQDGDRVWIVGRWVYDCGHPENNLHKSEIHPPKAIASFRSQATDFGGNRGPTRANHAIVFIGRDGGYWRQPIKDQNYAFDLYLPPKPYPEAEPRFKIAPQTGVLPVPLHITPFPAKEPRALRVVIPLKGVEPHPENYGVIISGGWSDPRGTEAAAVKLYRITVEEILMDANLDPRTIVDPKGKDEWNVYVGINGRWKVFNDLSGKSSKLDYSVTLPLHPSDQIHITACGYEEDEIDNLMGRETGLSWSDVCNPSRAEANAKEIRSGFLSLGASIDPDIENEKIHIFSRFHPPPKVTTGVTAPSHEKDYRLRYRIEVV